MKTALMIAALAFYAQGASQTFGVEVVASRAQTECEDGIHGNTNCREKLHITVLEGQVRLLLVSDSSWRRRIAFDLLPLGHYELRLLKEEKPTPYMLHRRYELQYQDGKTEQFELEGLE